MSAYCRSRYATSRRKTREVMIGDVAVGGDNPLRIQSMTTTNTQDVAATVKQSIALAEAGCEIIRVTAPNKQAARALREIRQQLSRAGFGNPLVADIHFLPNAAMEAVEHVEKVRVNPGNYADRKKFAVREYSDNEYEAELERLHQEFSPLVIRCRELGRALRVGTNHGSLSDRIMNRYGDTPLGMVESALEFLRIAESHDFRDIILSMKASNPKVMIQAYRLLVERMDREGMDYPLHLGVTEAGDGEDGRIKSAIGIGSLLMDGLGDTIRVSLTEDPVYEIPVAQALAEKAMRYWTDGDVAVNCDSTDPFEFTKRPIETIHLSDTIKLGTEESPTVIVATGLSLSDAAALGSAFSQAKPRLGDNRVEGLLFHVEELAELAHLEEGWETLSEYCDFFVLELANTIDLAALSAALPKTKRPLALTKDFGQDDYNSFKRFESLCQDFGVTIVAGLDPDLPNEFLSEARPDLIATLSKSVRTKPPAHTLGAYRALVEQLRRWQCAAPVWIRNRKDATAASPSFLSRLLDASILSGSLLCDGIGDLLSIESEPNLVLSTKLSYNVLQGAGSRITKTEFVACPSCGRTLFDLQSTTQRIREKTGHLKGVKIAIMGCIVNGPGEMADADFGYVGGAPGKINLYVGKECVKYNIPQTEADQRLVDLIREHGKWVEPELAAAE